MDRLKFYNIDSDYIQYLTSFDPQVLKIIYGRHNKFFCGIVLQIVQFHYFAPVTSLNKQQQTNFLICDKGRPISSIRFSFMVPAFFQVLTLTDFYRQPQTYQDLMNAEIYF